MIIPTKPTRTYLDNMFANMHMPAGPDHYGFTNNHVAILPGFDSLNTLVAYAILRKAFEVGRGPESCRGSQYTKLRKKPSESPERGWKSIETLLEEMPFEEALRCAEEIAKREEVVLYDDRSCGCSYPLRDVRRILWKPEGWRPIVG